MQLQLYFRCMDHEIFTWLSSRQDYSTGLLLYDKYCRNQKFGRILRIGGATAKNIRTLAYELGKIVRDQSPVPSEAQPASDLDSSSIQPVILPETTLEDIRKEQKMIYKMLDNLHAILPLREKIERARMAFEILDLDDRLKKIADRIDHYEKTGLILQELEKKQDERLSEKDPSALIRRQYSLRTYLTRYKKLLEESTSLKDRDRYQRKLDEYQREMELINKKLRV
jgi:hypothetical protein